MSNYELIKNNSLSQFTKILSQKRSPYPELSLFKKQLKEEKTCPRYLPYTAHKKQALTYRFIFFGFSGLFAILGILIFLKTGVWSPLIYTNLMGAAKKLVCFISAILSIATFILGFSLTTETDAIKFYVSKSQSILREIRWRKQKRFGLQRFFGFGVPYYQNILLKQAYLETLSKIRQAKESAIQLSERIRSNPSINKQEREVLHNQALSELNDQLEALLHVFNQSS